MIGSKSRSAGRATRVCASRGIHKRQGVEPMHDDHLKTLLKEPRVTKTTYRANRLLKHGVYAFFIDLQVPRCLKVGIAKPGSAQGIFGRLKQHFASQLGSSTLAMHLAHGPKGEWSKGFDFSQRKERQRFLSERCFVRALELSEMDLEQLRSLEDFIAEKLNPICIGSVIK